jgi:ParB-like chromosome segregation protein Spo0J
MTKTAKRNKKPWNWVAPENQPQLEALHEKLRRRILSQLESAGWQTIDVLSQVITDEDALQRFNLGCQRDSKDPVAAGRHLLVQDLLIPLVFDGSCELQEGEKGREFRLVQAAAGGDMIDRVPVRDLQVHSAARDVPDMRDEEWRPFLEDVREHGVRDPLTVQRGGVVLDGRHRLRAARESGQETVPARVVELTEEEQAAYVLRVALLRRHLSDDQRAVLAARWNKAEARAARSDRARKAGQASGRSRQKAAANSVDKASSEFAAAGDGKEEAPVGRTREKAAVQHGVPERKVRAALELEQQSPELAAKVLAGKMTLKQARRDLKATDSKKEGATAPKGKPRGPTSEANGAHGYGAKKAAGVRPPEPATEPGGPGPSIDDSGFDSRSLVGLEPWAQWLRSGFHSVDLAELATELIRRLGVERAARLRDALEEALAART